MRMPLLRRSAANPMAVAELGLLERLWRLTPGVRSWLESQRPVEPHLETGTFCHSLGPRAGSDSGAMLVPVRPTAVRA